MAGSRPPGEKRRDEDTLNASRRSDVSKYDPFWEPPPNERQAAWNKIAEAVEAYSVSTDASTLASLLREEAIVHFYMAEALERITDDPHQKSKAIEIKRSEAAQVESFPPRAVISEANYEEIRELVETGRRESVWEAFHTNPSLASDLIAEDAKIDQTLRQAADSTLTFLLQAQARVQLSMALALARIAEQPQQKSRAIEILLDEAAQLTDRETICPALRSLKSFEPLAVIPSLIAFLGKARDGPVRDAAFETFEHLILHGFAAYDSDPAAARRGRDLTLRFFVAILGATALDEPERVMVAGIVLRCAEILGEWTRRGHRKDGAIIERDRRRNGAADLRPSVGESRFSCGRACRGGWLGSTASVRRARWNSHLRIRFAILGRSDGRRFCRVS